MYIYWSIIGWFSIVLVVNLMGVVRRFIHPIYIELNINLLQKTLTTSPNVTCPSLSDHYIYSSAIHSTGLPLDFEMW